VTHVTPFAKKAKPAPRYGGLIPPFCCVSQHAFDEHPEVAL